MIKKIAGKRNSARKAYINRILEPGFATSKIRRLLTKASIPGVQKRGFGTGNLKMVASTFYIPKENEQKPLGEDACFICYAGQTIGVADGVGGWAKKGIDAGEYAREFMTMAFLSVQEQIVWKKGCVNPKQVLDEAFLNTKAKGSSTVCIITLKGEVLHAINVGDSGFVVIREGKVVYQSPSQQRRFNCPYQLGNESDTPDSAIELLVKVERGDILVAGTDGLFDNMFPGDIEDVVDIWSAKQKMPPLTELARNIAEVARELSLEKSCDSPFSKAAMELGLNHSGGKYDDVTVIVASIE